MKKISYIVLPICLFALIACPKIDYKNTVQIKNNSSKDITVYVGVSPQINGGSIYPDTVFPISRVGIEIKGNQSHSYSYNHEYYHNDTLCFFVWETDILNTLSWDSIRNSYTILKRYDLSLQDLQKLNWTIYYPPTEAMKDMKMYPPYKK